MSRTGPVFVLGDANVDVIIPIDEYPPPGGDKRSERMVIEAGGSAGNTAVVLAALGSAAHLLACIGDDEWARIVRTRLSEAGVDLGALQVAEGEPTGLMFVPVTPDGERTLFGRRGANRKLQSAALPAGLAQAGALHLSGYAFLAPASNQTAQQAVSIAEGAGALISMDTAFEPPTAEPEALRGVLNRLDLLVLGEQEASALSGSQAEDSAARLLGRGVGTLAVKLGSRGARLYQQDRSWKIPALQVETVDTTSAGDAFSAGLLHALLAGLAAPAAGLVATACGAAATTVWGGGAAFPGPKVVHRILNAHAHVLPGELKDALPSALKHLQRSIKA